MNTRIPLTLIRERRRGVMWWRARYSLPHGRYRFVNIGPAEGADKLTKRAAQQARAEAEVEVNNQAGLVAETIDMRLQDWVKKWLEIRHQVVGASTVALDAHTTGSLLAALPDGIQLRSITASMVLDWEVGLKSSGMKDATVHGHMRRVRKLFADAVQRKIIAASPMADMKLSMPQPDHFTPELSNEDCMSLVDACPNDDWRCIVAMCAFAGLRRGEALRVCWSDITWSTGETLAGRLTVMPKDNKVTTKSRRRDVYLEPMLESVLLEVYMKRQPAMNETIVSHEPGRGVMQRVMCGYTDKASGKTYVGVIRRAGFTPWKGPFQALRRRREDIWIEVDGRDEAAVLRWMGHSKSVSRTNYRTVSPRHYALTSPASAKDREIADLRARLEELTGGNQ